MCKIKPAESKLGISTTHNTVYKPLLGLCSSGKFLGIFQRSFVSLMVRVWDKQRLIHINVATNYEKTQRNQHIDKNAVKMSQTNRYQIDRFISSFVETINQN